MNFRIADTFTASLAKLINQEQKAAKTTAFDLQMDLSNPGLILPAPWAMAVRRHIDPGPCQHDPESGRIFRASG